MQDTSQIHTLLKEYADQTGNHCGLTVPELARRSGLPLPKVKIHLWGLYKEGKIRVRDGIHGKLIMIK